MANEAKPCNPIRSTFETLACKLPKTTQLRRGSRERSDNLFKVTELRSRSKERSGKLPKIT